MPRTKLFKSKKFISTLVGNQIFSKTDKRKANAPPSLDWLSKAKDFFEIYLSLVKFN